MAIGMDGRKDSFSVLGERLLARDENKEKRDTYSGLGLGNNKRLQTRQMREIYGVVHRPSEVGVLAQLDS